MEEIIAHLYPTNDTWVIQDLEDHKRGVANFAKEFCESFHAQNWGYILGTLHDIGKNTIGFQKYIRGNSKYDESCLHSPRSPHAYIGAIVANMLYPETSGILSFCIMGHHTGLHDKMDLEQDLKQQLPKDLNIPSREIVKFEIPNIDRTSFPYFIRMLFSSLVDADYLDTERFMSIEQFRIRTSVDKLDELQIRLKDYLMQFSSVPSTPLNKIRTDIQRRCIDCASMEPGFFSLTVPTGGGKTISSLCWAIHHALKFKKERIIIVIPYTSIITQTAAILRNIFGDRNVLEHHSAIIEEDQSKEHRNKLLSENWNAPIVVTTNIQFLESLFSNKPSKCRKLHNICNSVIIMDEVQTLPIPFLQPILDSLKALVQAFRCSILFTTASQPAIEGHPCKELSGIEHITEIIPNAVDLSRKLRRSTITIEQDRVTYDNIAQRINNERSVLCIVNTRKIAKEIFGRLTEDKGHLFHLSRMMCSAHLQKRIEEIKSALQNPDYGAVKVVATQLIEAGVDIDFPTVLRQEAGLNSIIQAAGRCNRENKRASGNTYVFRLEKGLPPGYMKMEADATYRLATDSDWLSPEVMKKYYDELYLTNSNFDEKGIATQSEKLNFEEVAKRFKLIDEQGMSVVVPYGKAFELIDKLKKEGGTSYNLAKQLGQYSVNLQEKDFKTLAKQGLINKIIEGVYLLNQAQYDDQLGVVIENRWLDEVLIY